MNRRLPPSLISCVRSRRDERQAEDELVSVTGGRTFLSELREEGRRRSDH